MSDQEENELICERLLGWVRSEVPGTFGATMWYPTPYGSDGEQWRAVVTPTFTTWAEAGLILDALAKAGRFPSLGETRSSRWAGTYLNDPRDLERSQNLSYGATGPLAIRAAALEYIRASGEARTGP